MHKCRRNSADDPRTQIITSPYIRMPLEDQVDTVIYGSPRGSMIFFNSDNPCMHSDAYTPQAAPGETILQRTVLHMYNLPPRGVIREFEQEMPASK